MGGKIHFFPLLAGSSNDNRTRAHRNRILQHTTSLSAFLMYKIANTAGLLDGLDCWNNQRLAFIASVTSSHVFTEDYIGNVYFHSTATVAMSMPFKNAQG